MYDSLGSPVWLNNRVGCSIHHAILIYIYIYYIYILSLHNIMLLPVIISRFVFGWNIDLFILLLLIIDTQLLTSMYTYEWACLHSRWNVFILKNILYIYVYAYRTLFKKLNLSTKWLNTNSSMYYSHTFFDYNLKHHNLRLVTKQNENSFIISYSVQLDKKQKSINLCTENFFTTHTAI